MEELRRFTYLGWTLVDIEDEISYYEAALEDPDEYDTDPETAQNELERFLRKKSELLEAYEAQRIPPVDYEDGTWV